MPRSASEAYEIIAAWPVPVYLTTNYDDEIANHLAALGEAFVTYNNAPDHVALLTPDVRGIVAKLHGDLRSKERLILTSSDYSEISGSPDWQYWRTKLTSIFQLHKVIVVGHSLTDPDVQHILAAAKEGAGVQNPVCWIAPDVPLPSKKDLLEKWRIRVIGYDNRDGTHVNLIRLLETVSDFVPPRVSVRASKDLRATLSDAAAPDQAAASLFVFNRLMGEKSFEERRADVVLAALMATPMLNTRVPFRIEDGLRAAGWPQDVPVGQEFRTQLLARGIEQGIVTSEKDMITFTDRAGSEREERSAAFEHLRHRFTLSLALRLRRAFSTLEKPEEVALKIESALIGFFRQGGLTLATTLLADKSLQKRHLPPSIARFMTEASTQFDQLLQRQAFVKVALDAFVRAAEAERDYLSRLAQGFFAFHALGVHGEAALTRLRQAKATVWLVDSNVQIAAVAVGAPVFMVWNSTFGELGQMGLRFFTTERLFDETHAHLRFAQTVIEQNGPKSSAVYAAAVGDAPYRKSNLFLQGFIGWQAAGNPCDWEGYLAQVGDRPDASRRTLESAFGRLGIEVVGPPDWPGFRRDDTARAREIAESIAEASTRFRTDWELDPEELDEMLRKAGPESEAVMIVLRERDGDYGILSNPGTASPAWFISQTAVLNRVTNQRITWQPDAFLRFASTLSAGGEAEQTEKAFEALMWAVAQAGVNVLDEEAADRVFGGVIDHESLRLDDQTRVYEKVLTEKYGDDPRSVVRRMRGVDQTLALVQLANEAAQKETANRVRSEQESVEWQKRAIQAETELKRLERYRRKVTERSGRAQRAQRRVSSKPTKSRVRKRKVRR